MAVDLFAGSISSSLIKVTIPGGTNNRLSTYYKTPQGLTPPTYPGVPNSGRIKYSDFRGGSTSAPVTAGSVSFGGGLQLTPGNPSNAGVNGGFGLNQPNDYGTTAPEGVSPCGAVVLFTIPSYNSIRFSMAGAGGTSGESVWNPADVIPRAKPAAGKNGNPGQGTYLVRPGGSITQPEAQVQRGFAHRGGTGSCFYYPEPVVNGALVAVAGEEEVRVVALVRLLRRSPRVRSTVVTPTRATPSTPRAAQVVERRSITPITSRERPVRAGRTVAA